MIRRFRLVVLAAGVVLGGAACSGMDTPQRPAAATIDTSVSGAGSSTADNPFIPEDVNIGDCVSSLPRPDCGSDAQGGGAQLATFGVLMAGMAFIGWRIARGVRRRERARSDVPS